MDLQSGWRSREDIYHSQAAKETAGQNQGAAKRRWISVVSTLNTRAATEEGQRCRGQQRGGGGPQTDGSWKWFREVEQAEDGILKYHVALQPSSRDSKGCCVHYYDVAYRHQCGAHVPVGLPVEHTHSSITMSKTCKSESRKIQTASYSQDDGWRKMDRWNLLCPKRPLKHRTKNLKRKCCLF